MRRDSAGDLASDELQAAARDSWLNRMPDTRTVVALPVVDRDAVAVHLGHPVRRAGVERRLLFCGTSRTLPNISLDEAW